MRWLWLLTRRKKKKLPGLLRRLMLDYKEREGDTKTVVRKQIKTLLYTHDKFLFPFFFSL